MKIKSFLLSLVAACLLLTSTPKSAHAYEYARDMHQTNLSLVVTLSGLPYPLAGLRWTEMVSGDWALVTQATSIGVANIGSFGANYYIYGDLLAFYAGASVGFIFSKGPDGLYLDAELGLEWSIGQFVLSWEAGPAIIDDDLAVHLTSTIGGRFYPAQS